MYFFLNSGVNLFQHVIPEIGLACQGGETVCLCLLVPFLYASAQDSCSVMSLPEPAWRVRSAFLIFPFVIAFTDLKKHGHARFSYEGVAFLQTLVIFCILCYRSLNRMQGRAGCLPFILHRPTLLAFPSSLRLQFAPLVRHGSRVYFWH
jgi:hypothetical protein